MNIQCSCLSLYQLIQRKKKNKKSKGSMSPLSGNCFLSSFCHLVFVLFRTLISILTTKKKEYFIIYDNLYLFYNKSEIFLAIKGKSSGKHSKKYIISNNPQQHIDIVPRVYEIPADTVIYEVKNLIERTEYQITLHMVTPHSDADKVKQLYESPSGVSIVEDDIWTPYVTTEGITAGIDSPEYLHVTSRDDSNVLSFEWKPAKAYGMYKLLYYVIRWNEVEHEETEYMTSRDKVCINFMFSYY